MKKKLVSPDRYGCTSDNRLSSLEGAVRNLHNNENPTADDYYALVLLGYRVYKQGAGLPHDIVKEAIANGMIPHLYDKDM